jgi:hypothetical protein
MDGKPMPHATVVFEPISGERNSGPLSQGTTNANGEFTLVTAQGNREGARVGKHKVSITAYEGEGGVPSSSGAMIGRRLMVPKKYNSESKMTFEVPPEGSTEAHFNLESDPK